MPHWKIDKQTEGGSRYSKLPPALLCVVCSSLHEQTIVIITYFSQLQLFFLLPGFQIRLRRSHVAPTKVFYTLYKDLLTSNLLCKVREFFLRQLTQIKIPSRCRLTILVLPTSLMFPKGNDVVYNIAADKPEPDEER